MNNRLTKQPGPGLNLLRRILGIKEKPLTRDEWRQWYNDYLKSPEWKRRADRCKTLAGHRCQECGAIDRPLHAHHLTYERVGNERYTDLRCLCDECHKEVHK